MRNLWSRCRTFGGRVALVCLLAVVPAVSGHADISLPAAPALTSVSIPNIKTLRIYQGTDQQVCKSYKTAFEQTLLDSRSESLEAALQHNGFSLPDNIADPSKGFYGFAVLKPFGNNGGYVVLVGETFGWRGMRTYVAYFDASVRLDERLAPAYSQAKNSTTWSDVSNGDPVLSAYRERAIAEHPLDGRHELAQMVWRHGKEAFVVDPIYDLYERSVTVKKIEPDGKLRVVCQIGHEETIPYKSVLVAYSEYQKALNPLMGHDVCGGTLNPIARARQYAFNQFKLIASNAPWRSLYVDDYTRSQEGYESNAEFTSNLSRLLSMFTNGSIYDNKATARYMSSREALVAALARYYRSDFDVSSAQAGPLAANVMVTLERAAFHIGEYAVDQTWRDKMTRLRASKNSREEDELYLQLKSYLDVQIASDQPNDYDVTGVSEKGAQYYAFVEALILKPRLFRKYLEETGKEDTANFFGKTLLMSAAHHDQAESVRLLLAHGANPDAVTEVKDQQCTAIQRDRRNALMYAAENAGPQLIKLLESVTKDLCQRDGQNNFAVAYVLANPRLSLAEKRGFYDRWLPTVSKCSGYKKPTFDCSRADNVVDMATCAGSSVTMWDENISKLYQQMADRLPDGAEKQKLKISQREWVKGKQKACAGPFGNYGELQTCVWQYTFQRYMTLSNQAKINN